MQALIDPVPVWQKPAFWILVCVCVALVITLVVLRCQVLQSSGSADSSQQSVSDPHSTDGTFDVSDSGGGPFKSANPSKGASDVSKRGTQSSIKSWNQSITLGCKKVKQRTKALAKWNTIPDVLALSSASSPTA